jgi:hypothetical protein
VQIQVRERELRSGGWRQAEGRGVGEVKGARQKAASEAPRNRAAQLSRLKPLSP